MALDPRIRVELERLGPGNVRELLRTAVGSGRSAPVAMQLPAVPDPTRSDIEDWLRAKERETERGIGAALTWARIAAVAAIIGVIVTALVGIAGIVVTLYTSGP